MDISSYACPLRPLVDPPIHLRATRGKGRFLLPAGGAARWRF